MNKAIALILTCSLSHLLTFSSTAAATMDTVTGMVSQVSGTWTTSTPITFICDNCPRNINGTLITQKPTTVYANSDGWISNRLAGPLRYRVRIGTDTALQSMTTIGDGGTHDWLVLANDLPFTRTLQIDGTNLGSRATINLISGDGIAMNGTNNAASNKLDVRITVTAAGGGVSLATLLSTSNALYTLQTNGINISSNSLYALIAANTTRLANLEGSSNAFIPKLNGTATNFSSTYATGTTNSPFVVRGTNGAAMIDTRTNDAGEFKIIIPAGRMALGANDPDTYRLWVDGNTWWGGGGFYAASVDGQWNSLFVDTTINGATMISSNGFRVRGGNTRFDGQLTEWYDGAQSGNLAASFTVPTFGGTPTFYFRPNVGIGTNAPAGALHVHGTAYANGLSTNASPVSLISRLSSGEIVETAVAAAGSTNNAVTAAGHGLFGSIEATNYFAHGLTNDTGTNFVADFNGRTFVRCLPSGHFQLVFTNVPTSPTTWRQVVLEILPIGYTNTVVATSSVVQIQGDAIIATNAISYVTYYWDGSNVLVSFSAELYTGTGTTNVLSVGPALVNATLGGITLATSVSNVTALHFAIQKPPITASNILVTTATNEYLLRGLTNVQLTNLTELPDGVAGSVIITIENTLGVSVPIMWPAFGPQHGYKLHTNGANDVLSATVAPPGTNTVVMFRVQESNFYARVTYWKR